MKRLKYTYIVGLVLIVGILSSTSCKKILEIDPHNTTFTNAYFVNGTDANTAISGAYSLLRSVLLDNYNYHVYGDAASGAFSINGGLDNANFNISNGEFVGLNVGSGTRTWLNYYKLIQQLNLIIEKVPGIDIAKFSNQDDKKSIIGEAYFLRAYVYFYMSRVWGDVPLKIKADLDFSQAMNIPRAPAAEVLKQCLADLKVAEENLVFGYSDEGRRAVRANLGSAYALEAHIMAWQKDYVGSEKASGLVITKGGYSLLDSASYPKVFIGKSLEGIFEINISYIQNEGYNIRDGEGGYAPTLSSPFVYGRTQVNWPVNTIYIKRIYKDTADIRYKDFFFQPESTQGQTIKFSNVTYADGSAKTQPRLSNNLIIFRLADIMLLRAEALNHLGRDAEALTMLNAVRARAGIPASQDAGEALNLTILEERLRELYYEGQSFYDLTRVTKLNSPTSHYFSEYNSRFDDTRINAGGTLWPVDPSMFKDDYQIVQTPYWLGKL
jgi:hypothetical protein